MENLITELEINNFKSIKHIKMDCKRINVLIGRPNVGKSNILEALALYNAPFGDSNEKFLNNYVRYEKLNDLFYDLNRKNQVSVISNLGLAALIFNINYEVVLSHNNILSEIAQQKNNLQGDPVAFFEKFSQKGKYPIGSYYGYISNNERLNLRRLDNFINNHTPIKKYHFKPLTEYNKGYPFFLNPPFGENIFTILENNPELWDECAGFFNNYGLDLLLDTVEEKLEVQKKVGRKVTKIPYSLAADTLQRYFFHLTAIESNNDSILLFEEPESHSFPPYISRLAEKIIENKTNQYFIATHSPYLLTPFIEQCSEDEVSIFIARYENYETKIKVLSKEEIDNIMETGIDLFFNIRAFQE